MRSDTKRLLDRLGQPDFNYREYNEPAATSTDRWPLFEVIARQMQQGLARPPEDAPAYDEVPLEEDVAGNDIQSLLARISKGRAT